MISDNTPTRFMPNKLNSMWWIATLTVALFCVYATFTPLSLLAQDEAGYTYAVQRGDNWDTVATRTGVPVETLQDANPQAIRANLWLRIGDDLFIPAGSVSPASTTRTHTVKFGESWSIIAAKYDIPIRLLQATNPDAIRTDLVLYQDEELVVPPALKLPSEETESEEASEEETDSAGEGAAGTASDETASAESASNTATAAPTTDSQDATGTADASAPVSSKEPAVAILDPQAVEAQATASANITRTQNISSTEAASTETSATDAGSSDVAATSDQAEGSTDAESAPGENACPDSFTDFPNPIEAALTGPDGNPQRVREFLANCGAEVLFQLEDWTADDLDDLLVIYKNPNQQNSFGENDLMIFNGVAIDGSDQNSFELKYRARSASTVNLLTTEDMNKDGQFDIAWLETTCGASTCFSTVNIRSWDGSEWADWTEETITMAYADVTRQEIQDGSGQIEFMLRGGMNGSAGAGPQRPSTEIWRSVDGAPYSMVDQSYDESPCLYFAVVDANAALDSGTPEGLSDAAALYKRVAADRSLISCDWRENEEAELRSFGRFRSALMAANQGDAATATEQINKLESTHAESAYAKLGRIWLDAYQEDGDPEQACAATEGFVEETPETWELLADYGYTNPSFSAEEVCPQIGRLAAVLQIVESATVEELLPGNRDGEKSVAPEAATESAEEATTEPAEEAEPEATAEPVEEAAPVATTEPAEEAEPEATAEPVEEAAPEAATEIVEEVAPEATTEPAEEVAPVATTEPVEEAAPEAATEIVEEVAPEATTEPAEEVAPVATTEPVEEAEPEATAESVEEAAPEAATEIVEEVAPEATAEPVEEAAPVATTEPVEEVAPVATAEPVEEAAPEAATEPVEEAAGPVPTSAIMTLAIVPQTAITSTEESTGTTTSELEIESTGDSDTGSTDTGSTDSEAQTTETKTAPACPQSLEEYGLAGQQALNYAAGDATLVKDWMLGCGVMSDEQGAIVVQDITADGLDDIVLYPVTTSDAGYGPDGTQGSVLIYHQLAASDDPQAEQFFLAANPDVFGKPNPLGIDDFNQDGLTDIVWTVEGCYNFCVTEVQLLSWNGEYYLVNIAPGATIAEGQAAFRPIEAADDSLGQGQELVLTGGVSGTPEGGLSVPHEEIWQSVNGAAYQRVNWTYDRDIDYNDCMGLRLVEADIALQSGAVSGYDTAVDLYINAINPVLKACSIYGMPQETEIIALQGLASFRLVQAQGLSGDLESAELTMTALSRGQPDSVYTTLAMQWLGEYRISQDPASACSMIQPLIDDNDMIWQITDHYGYNHPALAPEQICFQPETDSNS